MRLMRPAVSPVMDLANYRREFSLTGLRRSELDPNPIAQFNRWFDQADGARCGRVRKFLIQLYKLIRPHAGAPDVNAAILATADKTGRPSARVVLLKGVDDHGFLFFTNYESRKGRDLADNPH